MFGLGLSVRSRMFFGRPEIVNVWSLVSTGRTRDLSNLFECLLGHPAAADVYKNHDFHRRTVQVLKSNCALTLIGQTRRKAHVGEPKAPFKPFWWVGRSGGEFDLS